MPTIEIPGVGEVDFPDSMSPADLASAAKRLHDGQNRTTARGEDYTPAAASFSMRDYLGGGDGGPSVAGFGKNLVRGAVDTVRNLPESVPRVLKGITRLTPESIGEGIRHRVNDYAADPAGEIYNDPLSFLGDAATVLEGGAALRAPVSAGASAARSGARSAARVAAPMADLGLAAAQGAAENAFIVGPMAKGAYRGIKRQLATRTARAAGESALSDTAALEQVIADSMAAETAQHAATTARRAPAAAEAVAEPRSALREAMAAQIELPPPVAPRRMNVGPSAAEKFQLDQQLERELAQGRRTVPTRQSRRPSAAPTRYPDAWQPFMQQ